MVRLSKAIEYYVRKAVDDFFATSPKVLFVKAMQIEALRADPTMGPVEAWKLAVNCLSFFLKNEKIVFGDPTYAWDRSAAIEMIREIEIGYWETPNGE